MCLVCTEMHVCAHTPHTHERTICLHFYQICTSSQYISASSQCISASSQGISVSSQGISASSQDISAPSQDISISSQCISASSQCISASSHSVAECSVFCGTVPQLRVNSAIPEIAEKFRIWKKWNFVQKSHLMVIQTTMYLVSLESSLKMGENGVTFMLKEFLSYSCFKSYNLYSTVIFYRIYSHIRRSRI